MKYKETLIFTIIVCCWLFTPLAVSAEIYKYTDKYGVESFTDSIQSVPREYRGKAIGVKGLRQMDPAAKAPESGPAEKQGALKSPSKVRDLKNKVGKAAEDLKKTRFLSNAGTIAALFCVSVVVYALIKSIGSGMTGVIIAIAMVMGLTLSAFYLYSDELSGICDSYINKSYTKKSRTGMGMAEDGQEQDGGSKK